MFSRKLAFVCLVICFAACGAWAQQNVAPPPKPTDDGPSLADTMKFIQDKLSDQAKTNFIEYKIDNTTGRTWVVHSTAELTRVVANPGICQISYHSKDSRDGDILLDSDMVFNLKDVQNIVVMTAEQDFKRADTASGHPEIGDKVDPPAFALTAQMPHNLYQYYYFFFYDEALANRVAQAMVHAVELCGGGSKPEPF